MHGYKICLFVQSSSDVLFAQLAVHLAEIGDRARLAASQNPCVTNIVFSGTLSSGFLPISNTNSSSGKPAFASCAIFSGSSALEISFLEHKLKTIAKELHAATHSKGVLMIDDTISFEF